MNAAAWVALGVALAALLALLLRLWFVAWRAVMAQAEALAQGHLVETPAATVPGVRRLTAHLNASVHRLRGLFAAQAEQVALLQRQAQLDAVSGLPLRRHFVAQLAQRLPEAGHPGVALLIVRVLQLETLNPRLGHDGTDRVLGAVGGALMTYVERAPGTFAGRLNGADFALCLPVAGVALETAESLRAALAAAPALRAGGVEIAVGGADALSGVSAGAALAAADAALARAEAAAEAGDGERATVVEPAAVVAPPGGSRTWTEQIDAALAHGRARLAEFAVLDAEGRLIHLECPLRVQLSAGTDYQAATRWLALARRSRLLPKVDLAALDLALAAIASDGRPRAVHAAAASLATPGFIAEVTRRLAGAPRAARLLAVECIEGLRAGRGAESLGPLAQAVAAWRGWGVEVGVAHAGGAPQQLPALQATGIRYVKVDARHLRGVAADSAVRGYAQSLVALIHGLGLEALAEGIDEAADLAAVRSLGFDGATGPAVVVAAATA